MVHIEYIFDYDMKHKRGSRTMRENWANILKPGDLLVTRNENEKDNRSPGHWNHVGIYDGYGIVIEAQKDPGYVIGTPLEDFLNRYPEIRVLRGYMKWDYDRYRIATEARMLQGKRFRVLASLTRFFRRKRSRGENCVSTARRAYLKATGIDFGWRIPDDVERDCRFYLVVEKDTKSDIRIT